MTQARSQLMPLDHAGTYHCVQRCVRRAFLCGIDHYTHQSFEHRRLWVEERLHLVADCFAVAIHAYAIMSNHLHVVLQLDPTAVNSWSDEDTATRWVRLFPPREDSDQARCFKARILIANPDRMAIIRHRLGNLSWLMKCLAEPIARKANSEDSCKGRFWEGRFKSQLLCDDKAVLAAMAYVDLNPIRAGMTKRLDHSRHTSVYQRLKALKQQSASLQENLKPVAGTLIAVLPVRLDDYIELVQWTGKQVRPDKRGAIPANAPSVLKRFENKPERWTTRVKAIGSGYWRVVGEAQDLTAIAERLNQRWLKGVGTALALEKQS
ncbi:MAG: transposase [Arenimonas sp.]